MVTTNISYRMYEHLKKKKKEPTKPWETPPVGDAEDDWIQFPEEDDEDEDEDEDETQIFD